VGEGLAADDAFLEFVLREGGIVEEALGLVAAVAAPPFGPAATAWTARKTGTESPIGGMRATCGNG
jgi:hypothetical protein